MSFEVRPVVLEGDYVRLEPLGEQHAAGLFNGGQQQEDWDYMPRPAFVDLADCRQWVEESIATPGCLPFAILETNKGLPVGSTRYLNIRPEHRGLEIGYTWLGRDWQRTPVNTEAKLLLLQHAFESLDAVRVEFKTDARNQRSQKALERIGAAREGILRNHMIVQEGYVRDSVYFSITGEDWPRVKKGLQEKLG